MSVSREEAVFYADSYHPIQAGSINGTDTLPHDNAVYRAFLCSSAGLYDPFGDPKVTGDPYRTVFEDTLHKEVVLVWELGVSLTISEYVPSIHI